MENNENKNNERTETVLQQSAQTENGSAAVAKQDATSAPGNDKTENAPGAEAKSGEVKKYRRPAQRRTVTAQERHKRTLFLVQLALLVAIEAVFCFTPLGSLPAIGPIVMTFAMIPVIISAILFGTGVGTLMGFITGVFSLIVWTFLEQFPFMTANPRNTVIAFVWSPFRSFGEFHGNIWSLVICLVPRALTGTVTGMVYKGMCIVNQRKANKAAAAVQNLPQGAALPAAEIKKTDNKNRRRSIAACAIAAVAGSLTNTVLVLGGIYLFFGQSYAVAVNTPYAMILLALCGTVLTNGVPEAVLAGICAPAVCLPVKRFTSKQKGRKEAK